MSKERTYFAIDLKSFYASVECVERHLDPLTTNLVVADMSRTDKTVCLAVSPSLKAYGIGGRDRIFNVIRQVKTINAERKSRSPRRVLAGSSFNDPDLKSDPSLALNFIIAKPQMSLYIKRSTEIYAIYLKYVSSEDVHVYSVDEVFIDITPYLLSYRCTARELLVKILRDVLDTTGITATAGIGTNLYLAKIAMDIVAKHIPADKDGARIAELDEMSYRRILWTHRPLTDFWRVGRGISKKLEAHGLYTMGDIARCSLGKANEFHNETLLYKLFGVNAELLIDHAWGWEPCLMSDIKSYKSSSHSLSQGQVLHSPYPFEKAKLIVREMSELMALKLVDLDLACDHFGLIVGYDRSNFSNPATRSAYNGEISTDFYGREVPKRAFGTATTTSFTSSSSIIVDTFLNLFDKIVSPDLLVRRVHLIAGNVVEQKSISADKKIQKQLDLFADNDSEFLKLQLEIKKLEKENRLQKAILAIKKKYGKNAILKGMNFQEGATTIERNKQIGGHKA